MKLSHDIFFFPKYSYTMTCCTAKNVMAIIQHHSSGQATLLVLEGLQLSDGNSSLLPNCNLQKPQDIVKQLFWITPTYFKGILKMVKEIVQIW